MAQRSVLITLLLIGTFSSVLANASEFKIVILGLGGRSQHLLIDCLKFNKHVRVVAVCDDHAHVSLDHFISKLRHNADPILNTYTESFKNTSFYPDTNDGLQQLFKNHIDIDAVLITSANTQHLRHLQAVCTYCTCKNLYMEKPITTNLEEFHTALDSSAESHILIGLTLRYSSMAQIVTRCMQAHKEALGILKCVRAWERVRFCQGLTSFMMSWRRYRSLSGGLLLEKSIHDLDLALFFIQSLGANPHEVHITTHTAHNLFKKSCKQQIADEINHNTSLKRTLIGREYSSFQPLVPFAFDDDRNVDWQSTLDAIFHDFPEDDIFDGSDIIPDYHVLNAVLKTADDVSVNFELEVDISGLRPITERGMKFEFEHGEIGIDVMASTMTVQMRDGQIYQYDLKTNNSDHADGDAYIAQAILGMLPTEGCCVATLADPIVRLAMTMALISEKQAGTMDTETTILKTMAPYLHL